MFNWDKMNLTQRLIWLKNRANGGSGEFGELATVEGYTPLTLEDAVAKNIKSLTVRGEFSASEGTPPDIPRTIWVNSGVVEAIHQSGLSASLQLLDRIGVSNAAYINTYQSIRNTDKIIAEFRNSTTSGVKALYGVDANGHDCSFYAGGTYYAFDKNNNKVDTGIPVDTEWHRVEHDFLNGTLKLDDTTVNFEPYEFVTPYSLPIFSKRNPSGYNMGLVGELRSFKIIQDGEAIFDGLPVKSIYGVGLCNIVNGANTYVIPSDRAIAGNEVPDPFELTASGDGDPSLQINRAIVNIGTLYATLGYADEQEVVSGVITRRIGYHVFTGKETWINAPNGWITEDITDQLNAVYIPLCTHFDGTLYNPTAGTNSVRVYWTDGGTPRVYFGVDKTRFDTAQVWNGWLAARVSEGKPVILMYPLAEPKIERVKRQFPKTAKGTNTVERYSGLVTNYGTTIQYYKAVEE